MKMNIDISDDLQELRERMEEIGRNADAAIITRAALEIARLRGEVLQNQQQEDAP
jgi:hypothetical protein